MAIINKDEMRKVLLNKATIYLTRAVAVVALGYGIYSNPKVGMAALGYIAYEVFVSDNPSKEEKKAEV